VACAAGRQKASNAGCSREQWHDHLGDATVAAAVLDRILHTAHRIVTKGPSRRKEEATAK